MLRCAITPGQMAREDDAEGRGLARAALIARCGELSSAGVDLLLVREKELPAGDLVALLRALVEITAANPTRVLVAQRVDVAIAAGAAGVHLASGEQQLTPAQVRSLMPQAFVSVSCHTRSEVRQAAAAGADAILFAPVFGKFVAGVQVADAVGLEALADAVAAAGTTPVFALGGVNAHNAEACRASGASGVAGIRMFFG